MRRHGLALEVAAWIVVVLSIGFVVMLLFGSRAHGEEPCLTLVEAKAGGTGFPRYKERGEKKCWFLSDKRSRWAEKVAALEESRNVRAAARRTMAPPGFEQPREAPPHPPAALADPSASQPSRRIAQAFEDALPNEAARGIAVIVASTDALTTYLIGGPPSPVPVRTVAIVQESRFGWTGVGLIFLAALSGLYTLTALTMPGPGRPKIHRHLS